jgi:hypothetical protein
MGMEKTEFEFPDPDNPGKEEVIKVEIEASDADDKIDIEIVDDTPPKDRGRKPADPPEDVTEEELQDYSEKVRKRLQHFSKGYHDERRAKEDAVRKEEEAIRAAQAIADENRRLKEMVNKNQEVLLEQAKREAAAELAAKKRGFKEAYESGDPDAVVDAQEALTSATLKAEKVNNFTFTPLQDDTTEVQPASSQVADRKAQQWQEDNTWFGNDDEMTSFALGLHQKLVKQGVNPKSDEYYEKINSRMRQVFPENFESEDTTEEEKPRRKSNVVAPVKRNTAPKKIVLTATQVSIAKRLGVPLELYARQVAEEMRKQNG